MMVCTSNPNRRSSNDSSRSSKPLSLSLVPSPRSSWSGSFGGSPSSLAWMPTTRGGGRSHGRSDTERVARGASSLDRPRAAPEEEDSVPPPRARVAGGGAYPRHGDHHRSKPAVAVRQLSDRD